MAVPLKEINGEEGQLRIGDCVVADVKITHLLQNQVGGGAAHHHLAANPTKVSKIVRVRQTHLFCLHRAAGFQM